MSHQKEVKITKGDQEGTCLESSLPSWERHGWTRADDGSSEPNTEDEAGTTPPASAREAQ